MISEVEKNQKLIRVGDVLIYMDAANFQKWVVTDLFEGGFEATDHSETKDFYFYELQSGWSIEGRTKAQHELIDKFQYSV